MKAKKKSVPVIARGYHINARFFEYNVRRNVPSTGATGYMKPVITWKDVKYCPPFLHRGDSADYGIYGWRYDIFPNGNYQGIYNKEEEPPKERDMSMAAMKNGLSLNVIIESNVS